MYCAFHVPIRKAQIAPFIYLHERHNAQVHERHNCAVPFMYVYERHKVCLLCTYTEGTDCAFPTPIQKAQIVPFMYVYGRHKLCLSYTYTKGTNCAFHVRLQKLLSRLKNGGKISYAD